MKAKQLTISDDACRVCGKEDDESFLVLCDGCDKPFHTYCHPGCVCCNQKPKGSFNRKPAVPEGDWFCKFCSGHLPKLGDKQKSISSIFAWGDNEDGQLGLFDVEDKAVWEPTRVHELDATGVLAISSGETSTMVLTNDGDVYSVGVGFKGQLGHQDVVHEKLRHFRKIEALTEEKRTKNEGRITQIHNGRDFALVVTELGHIYTWGNGEMGQLGHQENKNKKAPKKVSALREREVPVELATCGDDFVLFTSKDDKNEDQFNTNKPGVLMSMGANTNGQLGDASNRNQWVPQLLNQDAPSSTDVRNGSIEEPAQFLLGRDVRLLSAGKAHAAVAVSSMKGIWTWGYGELGQLGHPKPNIPEGQSKFFRPQFKLLRPRYVVALNDKFVSQIVCGGNHTLLLLDDGAVWAFGSNEFGQVGLKIDSDTSTNAIELPTPVQALKGTSVKQIACGVNHSAALTTGGGVYTWGSGQYGQLGLGENKANNLDVPTKVPSLPIIKKIYSGPNQIFAVEYTNDTPIITVRPESSSTKKRGRAPASNVSKNNKKKGKK